MVSRFKGSSSARFVKNKNSTTVKTEYRTKSDPANGKEEILPMNNEAIQKLEMVQRIDDIDKIMGFDRLETTENEGSKSKKGWLVNMHATTIPTDDYLAGYSGVDYYFIAEEGGYFKSTIRFDPYFFLVSVPGHELEVEETLRKFLEASNIKSISRETKDDLAMPNHLLGLKQTLIKLTFHNVTDLLGARRLLNPIIKENQLQRDSRDIYQISSFNNVNSVGGEDHMQQDNFFSSSKNGNSLNMKFGAGADEKVSENVNPLTFIDDIREYDVPYHVRVSIDKNIRCGKWYNVFVKQNETIFEKDVRETFADPVVLAFDIETTKAPLKFPDSKIDEIMMISYRIDNEGYLITNRAIVSEDIEDFDYIQDGYGGRFDVFNEADEKELLIRFFEHVREAQPTVITTFNGDFFDWPFVEARAAFHGLSMFEEIGFAKDNEGEYKSKYCVHMDCYRWVKRDSYLPQGSQGLKAVTRAKLGYNPLEIDPELMTPYAYESPRKLARYSVSDAVATYFLYYKYVHPFIFSLCTIIPLNPDEVLRKGTGTLCEMLLMVQAYEKNILLPNKHVEPIERFYKGHLLESETYVGGHVESLEAGVFRSDIPTDFKVDTTAIDELIGNLHNSLKFCVEVENNTNMKDITNFDEVYNEIKNQLLELKNNPKRHENPLIYHVDVASMYPNIMISNRLQPDSMKTEEDCATCDFNRPQKNCDRKLPWAWRGEFYPADQSEYGQVKNSLERETFPPLKPWEPPRTFDDLSYSERAKHIKERLAKLSLKVYSRKQKTETVERTSIVCQRENPFYANTVRAFRDRRYDYKTKTKIWKGKASKIDEKVDPIAKEEANKNIVLNDSLQLAHKVILNSFYGYVMRKGSRWYSMEMAGITCLTGAHIIQMARKLVERIGRPLELDTDGIWCILPKSFPENFHLKTEKGKKIFVEYPCSMLNYLVHEQFTNHQYQNLIDADNFKYETKLENSIFFEVDGPYKAMILPTSKEEGKGLKKRYAVFNHDGSLAELKGFELKRRGELQLIKNFQSDIFKLFLEGDTLENCYGAVAQVANNWLDVLDKKGAGLVESDLIELICENRSMSKSLEEYGNQKSTSITTAKRLGEFLGAEMVKDAGLACKYIISSKPVGSPVTERAIPVSIFSSDRKEYFLKRWLKDSSLQDFDPKSVLDWGYYHERLASVVQKIISIPAALQGVPNPVPRIAHPDWLQRQIKVREDPKKQKQIGNFFTISSKVDVKSKAIRDIEDFGEIDYNSNGIGRAKIAKVTSSKRRMRNEKISEQLEEEEKASSVLNGECPSMFEDYTGFLQYQKARWIKQDAERQSRNKVLGVTSGSSYRTSVGSMIHKQAKSLSGSNWEILQYKQDPLKPGDIKVYVFANKKLHVFNFHIPKKFFATFKTELTPSRIRKLENMVLEMEKSNAILPNGHDASNLYKFTMTEDFFANEVQNVESVFQSSNLLGLYETQIDPVERAIIELGNSIKFDDTKVGALGKGLNNGFNMKDLTRIDSTDNYLKRFEMDMVYLLHIVTNSYEFFTIFKSWDSKAKMFILKPSNSAQELPPTLSKIYEDLYQAKKGKIASGSGVIEYPETMDFETSYFKESESKKMYKRVNDYISKIHSERSNKAMFAIQSPYPEKLESILKSTNDFPSIKMNISELQLPAIGWQSLISQRIMNHYFVLSSWIKNLITLSRYGNIPLCNLKIDNMGYLVDIEYARRLISGNIVLWWSVNPLPDHGGFEMDKSTDLENLEFPQINNPNIYETACLEVEIGTLTINTILTSSLINEAEGSDLADGGVHFDSNNGASTIAEDSFSTPALSILRSMVKDWWDDALKSNINADSMMNSLITWVQKKDSYLYDFALHYHVHNLTTKTLLQLIGEFRRMNSNVVFANRNKLIVQTSKVSVENSYAYGLYIIKAARSKPLFNFLDMKISRYWDILVWMDEYNYGGRCCYEITSEDVQDLYPVSQWQIQNFLPVIYQNEFEDWLIIFLDALTKNKNETMLSTQKGSSNNSNQRVTQIAHILKGQKNLQEADSENGEKEMSDSVVDTKIIDSFRRPLLNRIEKLMKKQNESILNPELKKEYDFPNLPGSYFKMANPTLELVKYLCAVFGLFARRNIEVRILRKELLSIFDIKEFSKESIFQNPSTSLKIPLVVCDYCNFIRDIDFCRDLEQEIWSCGKCSKPYNRVALEENLILEYCKLLTRYYVQDLKCSKCHQIKSDDLSAYCKCSGKWVETINYHEIEKRKSVFQNVARTYNLLLFRGFIER